MPILAALLLLCGAAFAGDTTYSRTETVPKSSSGSPPAPAPSSPADVTGDDDDGWSSGSVEFDVDPGGGATGIMAPCFDFKFHAETLGQIGGMFIMMPLWVGICGLGVSHLHLITGWADMDEWPAGRWRFGGGIGFGAAGMPGVGGGLPLEAHLELTGAVSDAWQVRLRSGVFANFMSPSVDFRRDVFVDGKRIGGQLDVMDGYMQAGFDGFADLIKPLWHSGLYLAAGLGTVLCNESIEYTRRNDFARGEEARKEDRSLVLPAFDLALGRYGGGASGPFWRFEIRYQAMFHSPLRVTSFPADNSEVTQQVTWEWAWF